MILNVLLKSCGGPRQPMLAAAAACYYRRLFSGTAMEISQIRTRLSDLDERTQALRGYL